MLSQHCETRTGSSTEVTHPGMMLLNAIAVLLRAQAVPAIGDPQRSMSLYVIGDTHWAQRTHGLTQRTERRALAALDWARTSDTCHATIQPARLAHAKPPPGANDASQNRDQMITMYHPSNAREKANLTTSTPIIK